jgi:phosphoribosylglycinamide formyltransferase-1
MRIAIFVSGRGSNMEALLQAHQKGELKAEPVVVLSNRAGVPALEKAQRYGIPAIVEEHKLYPLREDHDRAMVGHALRFQAEGAVLAGYMRLVTPVLISAFPRGVINIHPSLLPAFAGAHAVKSAWEYGVKVTGCTVHFVNERMDEGPIILQRAIEVKEEDTPESLAERLLDVEHLTLIEAVNLWAEGRLRVEGRRVRIL